MPEPLAITTLQAALGVRLIDARVLPALAEEVLGLGYETPALVRLASMGTEPFDPRDARATGLLVVEELGIAQMEPAVAAEVSGALLAVLLLADRITAHELTELAEQLVIDSDYQARGDLMELMGMNNAWDQAWAGPNDRVEASVRSIAARMLERFPEIAESSELPRISSALHFAKHP
jgi:hypothetical protein